MFDEFNRVWGQSAMSESPLNRPQAIRPELDVARLRIEGGPGGDVDADGRLARAGQRYVPGLRPTVSVWLRLYEQVQRGEVGGSRDAVNLA